MGKTMLVITWWFDIKKVFRLVQLHSFDTATLEGRSQERHRRVVLTAIASVVARGVSIITSLVSIPLTVSYLGTERYGMWLIMSSFLGIFAFADLGLGNGLVNAIAEANGREDRQAARHYVSNAVFLLSAIAFFIGISFVFAYQYISWRKIFNISSYTAIAEAGPSMIIFVTCFLINLPIGIVQRVQMGYQEGFKNSIWLGIGNLLGLINVLLAIYLHAGLPWLILALAGTPILTSLLNGLALFVWQRPWLKPRWHDISVRVTKRLLRIGALFFVLQIAGAFAYQSDNIVIAQILGPDSVTRYAVPMKLFALSPLLLSFLLTPLWPAYGEAIARNDINWVRRTLKRSIAFGLLINISFALVLVLLGATILRVWIGPQIAPSFTLLLGMGIWTIMNSFNGAISMFLNASGKLAFQITCALLMSVSNLSLSIFLTGRIGLPGPVYGSIVAQLLFVLIPSILYIPRLLTYMQQATRQ